MEKTQGQGEERGRSWVMMEERRAGQYRETGRGDEMATRHALSTECHPNDNGSEGSRGKIWSETVADVERRAGF